MGKSIKSLREERNKILDELDSIKANLSNDKGETRSLNKEETRSFEEKTKEIESIDKQIEELRNSKTKQTQVEDSDMEQRNIKQEEIEKREGVQAFLRKDFAGVEKRAQYVNTTEEGNVLIPEHIADEIIQKMEESSPVFQLARKYPSAKGILKIAKENTDDQAGFVGENQEIPSIKLKFSHVTLTQKRVGAAITLTQHLLNDSEVDLLGYSADILARKTVKAIEKSMFLGEGGEDAFLGLLSVEGLAQEGYNKVELDSTLKPEDFVEITNSINPAYLDQAAFYMSRETYNQVSQLKDGNGDFLLQSGEVNGRIGRVILGFPVFISDQLTAENGILFGNIAAAYGIMIKKGFALKHVNGDTQQTLNGTQLVALDGYMDGNIINAEALVHANTP